MKPINGIRKRVKWWIDELRDLNPWGQVNWWIEAFRDPRKGLDDDPCKARVDFFLFTTFSPLLIPYLRVLERLGIRVGVRTKRWQRLWKEPPIFRLLRFRHKERERFYLDELQQLIAEGADVNAREKEGGETALHLAARCGRVAVCRVLLAAGADPNAERFAQDFSEEEGIWVPIFSAYLEGNVELLEVLLEAGADPHVEAWVRKLAPEEKTHPDAWLERQRPEMRDRLRQWKAEQEEKRLEETLPDATKTAPKIRARL